MPYPVDVADRLLCIIERVDALFGKVLIQVIWLADISDRSNGLQTLQCFLPPGFITDAGQNLGIEQDMLNGLLLL